MKRLKYQEQDCELTLKQGLEEYLDHIGPEAKLTGDENNSLDEGYRQFLLGHDCHCLLYTSPSPRDRTRSRMPSSA